MSFNPTNPTKYKGTDKYITFFVTRNRAPTSADFRQPETGRNYAIATIWQVGKDPSTGTEGDEWILSKIVANVAYWIKFIGSSGPLLEVTVDAVTAPGVNPVLPDASGNITVQGAIVAAHSVPVETHTRALNEYNIELQFASAIPSTDPVDVGLSAYSDAQFAVDADGFVTLFGGSTAPILGLVPDSFTPPGTSPVIPDGSGNITVTAGTAAAGTTPVQFVSLAANTIKAEIQFSQAIAATDADNVGLSAFDSAYFTVDANGFVTLSAGNTDLHWPVFIVGDVTKGANYATIAAAVAASASGNVIAIQPGTYTENISLTTKRIFVGLGSFEDSTIIIGKISDGGNSISYTIMNLKLQTNSDYCIELTAASSYCVLRDVYLNCTNNTGINMTQASATTELNFCTSNTTTTGIGIYTGSGVVLGYSTRFQNSGSTTTASTSSGSCQFINCSIGSPITCSGAASIIIEGCGVDTSSTNSVAITTAGTGSSQVYNSVLSSGSAAAISVGAGTIVFATSNTVRSSAANVFTGAGTINTGGNVCTSSSGNNVVTINNLTTI